MSTHATAPPDPRDTTVADLITREVLIVGMNQPVTEVHAALTRRGSRFAAVRQGTRITAVVDRETLDRLLAAGRRDALVRSAVHPGAVSLLGDARPRAAERILRSVGCAALPVVDEHHTLLGLVTAEALAVAVRAGDASADGSDRPGAAVRGRRGEVTR